MKLRLLLYLFLLILVTKIYEDINFGFFFKTFTYILLELGYMFTFKFQAAVGLFYSVLLFYFQ